MRNQLEKILRQMVAGVALLAVALSPSMAWSQVPQPVPAPVDTGEPVPVLSIDQLQGLVAPIALYPDPLISQILVASTYPLEVVEAYQWLQQNPGLTGPRAHAGCRGSELGSQRSGISHVSRRVEVVEPGCQLDNESGKRFLESASRCHECRSANAVGGGTEWQARFDPAATGDNDRR